MKRMHLILIFLMSLLLSLITTVQTAGSEKAPSHAPQRHRPMLPLVQYQDTTQAEAEVLHAYAEQGRRKAQQAKEAAAKAAQQKPKTAPKNQPQPAPAKVAYLTFDDGPDGYTPQILDLLKKRGLKATFFLLAHQIEAHEDTVKRMNREGHSIGLHGVTHDYHLIYRSPQTVVAEMEADNKVLERVTGRRSSLMRVPYGSKPWMPQSYRDATANAGYHMWDWNIDSTDSTAASVPADRIVSEVEHQVSGKQRAVILMHDKRTTLEALPRILDFLQKQGFAIEPIKSSLPPLNFWNDER